MLIFFYIILDSIFFTFVHFYNKYMGKRKVNRQNPIFLNDISIEAAGAEGKALARHEGKVIFMDFGAPGDVVDIKIHEKKQSYCNATIIEIKEKSVDRVDPFCSHFGLCGGCKWQHLSYEAQLKFKQQQVHDAFERIGKFPFPELQSIVGPKNITRYRNKLEFSFTDRKWLDSMGDKENMAAHEHAGVGFHIPGRFDKILDVEICYLMDDLQNKIRHCVKDFAVANGFTFFNARSQEGFLRSMFVRNTSLGEWMVIIVFKENNADDIQKMMQHVKESFPQLTSLLYIINDKRNDTIYDLDVHVFAGREYIIEKLEALTFHIQPKSFFQTNIEQTLTLYSHTRDFAGLTGEETVYDLYTGVGSIANFVARKAKSVIGIESVEAAIEDAKVNAGLNNITNTHFYAGDMKDVLNDDLIAKHGKADVIITDPPRAGMHEDVVNKIKEMRAEKIVYVSCNPSTQARDIAMLSDMYDVVKVQPVDMFPHTHHVENIALLRLKN